MKNEQSRATVGKEKRHSLHTKSNNILIIIIIIVINLIYIAQFDTNSVLTALYIIIKYIFTSAICAHTGIHETVSHTHIIYMSIQTCIH